MLAAKMIVMSTDQKVVYTNLDAASFKELKEKRGAKSEFLSAKVPILTGAGAVKGYVVLVAKVEDIQKLNGLMKKSLRWGFLISAAIALLICIIFQRKITLPIRKLTEHMRNFNLKRDDQRLSIQTKDEVEELADSFHTLTQKIRSYDQQQKVFFQNASHELKTPLMAIQGNAEAILDGVVKGKEVNESLTVIINESQRLKKLVEEISFLSKLEDVEETFHFTPTDMSKLLEESMTSVQALAKQRGIELTLIDHVRGTFSVDGDKIKRAFINLLGNAIRYAETMVTMKGYLHQGKIIFEVSDDGKGLIQVKRRRSSKGFTAGKATAPESAWRLQGRLLRATTAKSRWNAINRKVQLFGWL
jgi:signal transduction histidine kinase